MAAQLGQLNWISDKLTPLLTHFIILQQVEWQIHQFTVDIVIKTYQRQLSTDIDGNSIMQVLAHGIKSQKMVSLT